MLVPWRPNFPTSISECHPQEVSLAGAVGHFFLPHTRLTNKAGNRRAFVQFEDVDLATAFIKEYFPIIVIKLRHATDDAPDGKLKANIHFARNRDDGEPRQVRAADWTCPQVCIPELGGLTKSANIFSATF
jgi:hypothetical protein